MDAVLAIFLFLGLPFFIYWLCCGGLFIYVYKYLIKSDSGVADIKEDADGIPTETYLDTFKNSWVWIGLLIDTIQLVVYSFDSRVFPWPSAITGVMQRIFDVFFLRFDSGKQFASFWLLVAFACGYGIVIGLMVIGTVFGVEKINDWKDKLIDLADKSPFVKTIGEFMLFELPPWLYLPLAWTMFEWLACTYSTSPPHLDKDPTIICWHGIHLLYALFSVLSLALFYPITLLVSVGRVARVEAQVNMKSNYLLAVGMLKFAISSITAMFTTYIPLYAISLIILNAILLVLNIIQRPCNVRKVNHWRTAALSFSLWCSLCAGSSILFNFNHHNDDNINAWIAGILLLSGALIMLGVFATWHAYRFPTPGAWEGDLATPLTPPQDILDNCSVNGDIEV